MITLHPPKLPALLAALLLAVGSAAMATPARAQHVLVTVNGDPITAFDVETRSKFLQVTTHKTPTRQEVIEDLINDKLKLMMGKRYRLEIDDADVNRAFNNMAHQMRLDGEGLERELGKQGIAAYTLKDRIRAELVWQQIVRGKFYADLQSSEKEVAVALESRKTDDKTNVGYEYTLRPILFIIPRNSPEGTIESRKRDAEALRARFDGCDTGVPMARGMRDVAVREPIRKTSADLAPALRDILDKTPVGKTTDLEMTPNGVEFFALCSKRESKLDTAAKRDVQNELFSKTYNAKAKKLLDELRKQAMIEYKEAPPKDAPGKYRDAPPKDAPGKNASNAGPRSNTR